MPRLTKQATIEAQAQEIEALKQELAQAKQAQAQEQAYIKALAQAQHEIGTLKAELSYAQQGIELAQGDCKVYRAELAQAQELAESQAEKLVLLEARNKSLTRAFYQADEKLAKQVQEIAHANKVASEAFDDRLAAKQALDNTESLLWDTQAELNKVKQELAQVKPSLEALQAELAHEKGVRSFLEREQEQAKQALQAEQEKHKQALTRERGLRADIEGTSLQLEALQAELAQAYEQGEKEYQALRFELVQAHNEQARTQAKLEQAKQEQAELEQASKQAWQAWNEACVQLCEQAQEHRESLQALKQELAQALQAFKSLLVTPGKQGQAQELDLYLSGLE